MNEITPSAGTTTAQRRAQLVELLLLGLIVVLAAWLRAYHLGYKSLWLDEMTYVRSAQLGGLFGPYGLASISHPPLYLFVMRLLSDISRQEWLLRFPALLASTANVIAIWALGRSLLGRVVGLLAAFLLALSTLHVEYGQEAHSYAFFSLLSTILLWALWRAARREVGGVEKLREPEGTAGNSEQRKDRPEVTTAAGVWPGRVMSWLGVWGLVVLVAVLSLYTHYYALAPVGLSLVVFPLFLLAVAPGPLSSLWHDPAKRHALLHLVLALAVIVLLFLPQMIWGLTGSARIAGDRAQAVESGLLQTQFDLKPALFLDTLLAFITNRSPWYVDPLFAPTVAGLALVGLVWLLWRRTAIGVALMLWTIVPLPLLAWFAYQASFSFAPRRLIFILPIFLLFVAAGMATLARLAGQLAHRFLAPSPSKGEGRMERLRESLRERFPAERFPAGRIVSAAVLGVLVLLFVKGSIDPLTAYYRRPKQDWRGLATILQAWPEPDDAIVVLSNAAPLDWYWPTMKDRTKTMAKDLTSQLQRLCKISPAVYVASSALSNPLAPDETAWLNENYIAVPLKDLTLYYRNCQRGTWYGTGAEPLFRLAQPAGLTFPAAGRALRAYQALAEGRVDAAAAEVEAAAEGDATAAGVEATAEAGAAAAGAQVEEGATAIDSAPAEQATATPTRTPIPTTATPASPAPILDATQDLAAQFAGLAKAQPNDAGAQLRLGAFLVQEGSTAPGQAGSEAPALDEAGAHFRKAIELEPQNWLPYALWAESLSNTGQITQALQTLQQGLEAVPDSPALTALQSRLRGESGSENEEALQSTIEASRAAMRNRDWAAAITTAEGAADLAPNRYETQFVLGDAYRGAGQLDDALTAYERAVELAPHFGVLHARRSEILTRLGQPREALDAALTALAIDQGRWENWLALGRAYQALGTTTTIGEAPVKDANLARLAETALQKSAQLAPAEATAPQRALDELRSVLASAADVQPTPTATPDIVADREAAQQLLQVGEASQALLAFQALVKADSTDRESRMGLAAALAALDRVDEALAEYEQISADWPDFPFAQVRRGELLEKRGDQPAALAAYQAAVKAAPGNADAHFSLAFAYRRAGQVDEAIAELEAGLALDPGRETARQALDELKTSDGSDNQPS